MALSVGQHTHVKEERHAPGFRRAESGGKASWLPGGEYGEDSGLENAPQPRHIHAVTMIVQLDGSNRIVLPRELRRAAGIPRGQKLKASATAGRIVLELQPTAHGKVVKRGKLKLWTGEVPSTPLAEAVEAARHYER
jgi:bifunctional DNA-binding transcriptional regulator/antitoxin component of YhaV-PrlF toxin-antitoxin module